MDQPSDSTNSFQAGIEKLIQIGHSAAYLSCQIQEVTAILTGTMQEGNPDPAAVTIDDLGATDNLNSAELMELIALEHSRQALVKSWRYVEGRKARIIQQARTRITDAG